MRKAEWGLLGIVVLAFVTGIAFYPYLPAETAMHWNLAGGVDGYMPRAWGAFLLPILLLIIAAILFIIPRIDPKRKNIEKFRIYFDYFIVTFGVFFYYVYLLTLIFNIGYYFNLTAFIIPSIAILFYLIGVFLPHTEVNFTIGIRTPWTISSPRVWKKTHDAGGVAFKMCGVIGLLGVVFPEAAIWLLFVPIAIATIGLVIYSYVLYEREGKRRKR